MSQPRSLDFQCALITGGGGGLGFAMAKYFQHALGKKVILAGRTEEKLQAASKQLNDAPYYVMDTGDVASLKAVVDRVTQQHPEVDALINNAGVQRPLDVANLDLEKADNEININIRGPVHLATHMLPHLAKQKSALIANVSSVLGFVPYSLINPIYNGTKSFLHVWTVVQRTQLAKTHPNIKILEIVPPSTGTDLHRERENPDDNKVEKGAKTSITVEQFIEEVAQGLEKNNDEIGAGSAHELIKIWNETFGAKFNAAVAGKR